MKKIFSILLAVALACGAASAQYCPSTQGQTLVYHSVNTKEKTDETYKSTVVSAEKDAEGVLSVRMKETHTSPENPLEEMSVFTGFRFNPADTVTTVIMMSAPDFKDLMVKQVKDMLYASGQYPSDSDMQQFADALKVSGELAFPIPANPVNGAVFDKSVLRTSVMGQNIVMRISKGSYLGRETVETPAGKFDCAKLTYAVKNTGMGNAPEIITTAWYADGVGLVRSTETDKKGNEVSSEELIEIK